MIYRRLWPRWICLFACIGLVFSFAANVQAMTATVHRAVSAPLEHAPGLHQTGIQPASRVMYSDANAVAYADKYAMGYNSTWPRVNDDCTNFVSQALYAGGLPMTNWGITEPPGTQWWGMTVAQGGRLDTSWTFANTLYWYLRNYSYAVQNVGSWYGSAGSPAVHPYTPNAVVPGDPIFYDWTSNGSWDHASMQTGLGKTSDGYNGNYIDQHTNGRKHSFWSGWSFNQYRNTTTYGFLDMIS